MIVESLYSGYTGTSANIPSSINLTNGRVFWAGEILEQISHILYFIEAITATSNARTVK